MHPDKLAKLLSKRLQASGLDYNLIADIIGARASTVDSWGKGGHLPFGKNLNALWHLLAIAGVNSPELARVPAFSRYLGELLALRLISVEDVMEACNLKLTQAFSALRGTSEPQSPKYTLEYLRDVFEEDRQKAIEILRQRGLRVDPSRIMSEEDIDDEPDAKSEPVLHTPPAPSAATQPSQSSDTPQIQVLSGAPVLEHIILDLAQRLLSLLPLLNYMVSDKVGAVDRGYLRQLTGQDNMFRLTTTLSALNSERVRNAGRDNNDHQEVKPV